MRNGRDTHTTSIIRDTLAAVAACRSWRKVVVLPAGRLYCNYAGSSLRV